VPTDFRLDSEPIRWGRAISESASVLSFLSVDAPMPVVINYLARVYTGAPLAHRLSRKETRPETRVGNWRLEGSGRVVELHRGMTRVQKKNLKNEIPRWKFPNHSAPLRRCARAPKMLQPPRPCFGQEDSRGRSGDRLPPGPAGRGSVQSVRNPRPHVAARVSPPTRPSSARGDFARVRARSKHSRPLSRANGAGLGLHRGPLRGERRGQLRSALP